MNPMQSICEQVFVIKCVKKIFYTMINKIIEENKREGKVGNKRDVPTLKKKINKLLLC